MSTLAAAYLVGWIAVVAYAGWLGVQQHRLSDRIEQLQEELESRGASETRRVEAA